VGKISSPVTDFPVGKTEISVTGPTFSYEPTEILRKEIEVRRDLRNRESPVNQAHMKRPLVLPFHFVFLKSRNKSLAKYWLAKIAKLSTVCAKLTHRTTNKVVSNR